MKKLLAALFVALLLVGCGGEAQKQVEERAIDLDDNETRNRIIAEAIEKPPMRPIVVTGQTKLDDDRRRERAEAKKRLFYAPNQQTPYTGWVKTDSGNRLTLMQYKDGKQDGLWTMWYSNGQKKFEGKWKDGLKDGLQTQWYSNGQKSREGTWKRGKEDGLWTSWNENGQKKFEGK